MKRSRVIPALIVALLVYSFYVSAAVRNSANQVATGRPFCIQVARDGEYRQIRSASDLLGLRMRGSGGFHHAVLVTGNGKDLRTFHWSYFKHRFVTGTYGPHPIVCRPSPDFFKRLDDPVDDSVWSFVMSNRALSIPRKYNPKADWPGSFVGYTIKASAPQFHPTCTGRQCDSVSVAFEGGLTPANQAHGFVAEARDEGKNLDGLVTGVHKDQFGDIFIGYSPSGALATYVSCSRECLQVFSQNGLTYTFRHTRRDLPKWRAMQEKLVKLHQEFER